MCYAEFGNTFPLCSIITGVRNAPYGDIYVAWYKAIGTTHSRIFSAPERNLLRWSSERASERQLWHNMYYLTIFARQQIFFKKKHLIWSSPRCPLLSHSLVCIENNMIIVGIGPILNKELEFIFRSDRSDCTCVYS